MTELDLARDIAEYIQLTGEIISDMQEKVASQEVELTKQAAVPEPKVVEKVVEKPVEISSNRVASTVGKMVKANFLTFKEAEDAEEQIKQNPEVVLDMIDKLAARELQVVHKPIAKSTVTVEKVPTTRESDTAFEQMAQNLSRRI